MAKKLAHSLITTQKYKMRLWTSSARHILVLACYLHSGLFRTKCKARVTFSLVHHDVSFRYNFKSDPRTIGAIVILSANESSYSDPGPRVYNQGIPHPTAWFQEHGAGVETGGIAGRSFYTSLGHLSATWADPLFIAHVMGGITWTLQSNTTRAVNSSAQVGNAGTSTTVSSSTQSPSASSSAPGAPSTSNSGSVSMYTFISLTVFLMMIATTWTSF